MTQRRDATIAAGGVLAVLGAAALIGAGGWPGAVSACVADDNCACETLAGGLIEQPINTWSSLGFIAVGLWILAAAGGDTPAVNRMTTEPMYRRLYGAVALVLGIGAMLFHGTMTRWGGWADLMSMTLFISYLLCYAAARLLDRGTGWFVSRYLAVGGLLGVALWLVDQGWGKYILGVLIVTTLVLELTCARHPDRRMPYRLLWAGLGIYLAGGVVWVLSGTGGPLCDPDSLAQGHALWHLTAAAAVAVLYRYLAGEEQVISPRRGEFGQAERGAHPWPSE